MNLPQCLLSEGDGSSCLCRTLQQGCRSWRWFPGTLLFPTDGPWQQLHEVFSVQLLTLIVLCILSPGLHLAPTSHSPVLSSTLSLTQSVLGPQIPVWKCSQRNMLSCAFQETAVYGEHIWFETNVSGDFCYVGEQNCMAKLLVSHWGPPASWQGLQMWAVLLPSGATTKVFLLGDMQESGVCQGRECVPSVSVCWRAASPISASTGAQFAMGT